MRTHRGTVLALGTLLLASAAAASEQAADEMIVCGTPTELALDAASLRIDVKRHAEAIAASVRDALATQSQETRVATASARERG